MHNIRKATKRTWIFAGTVLLIMVSLLIYADYILASHFLLRIAVLLFIFVGGVCVILLFETKEVKKAP